MKRRNAEPGKMRRPLKRTKIVDGMYGNGLLYLKYVMIWVTVAMANYMVEFRFEFLWPFWMMLRSLCDSYKYQGLAFSIFFVCIVLTSDLICFFFIPLQYIYFAASTYVWVQYIWYTLADKGICVPTVALCCVVVYVEGALRVERSPALCRPLAAHCVGYPVVTLGFGVKSLVGAQLRLRRQRRVRAENDFYFQLMRAALPQSALEQSQSQEAKESSSNVNKSSEETTETKHMNGSLRRRTAKDLKPEPQTKEKVQVHFEKQEKVISAPSVPREKEKEKEKERDKEKEREKEKKYVEPTTVTPVVAVHSNGNPPGLLAEDEKTTKSSAKSPKCEKNSSTLKEEKKRLKHKENTDSHKSSELTKEQNIVKDKEVESKKDSVKCNKECYSYKEREKEREKERDREMKEKEKEFEKEREKERESRLSRERWWSSEVRRLGVELQAARDSEHEVRRQLERARRKHTADCAGDRRTRNEQKAKAAHNRTNSVSSECGGSCRAAALALEAELAGARARAAALQQQLAAPPSLPPSLPPAPAPTPPELAALRERALHLERALSAETRVKLDLLSALGEAKRQLTIHEGVISKQDKEIEDLKAQMFAVLPPEFVTDDSPSNVNHSPTYGPINNANSYANVNSYSNAGNVNNYSNSNNATNVNSYSNSGKVNKGNSFSNASNHNSFSNASNVNSFSNAGNVSNSNSFCNAGNVNTFSNASNVNSFSNAGHINNTNSFPKASNVNNFSNNVNSVNSYSNTSNPNNVNSFPISSNVNSFSNASNVNSYTSGNHNSYGNANNYNPNANFGNANVTNVTNYPQMNNVNNHANMNNYQGVKLLDPNASAYKPKQLCSDA